MKKLLTPLALSAVLGSAAFGSTVALTQFSYGPLLLNFDPSPVGVFTVPSLVDSLAARQVSCPPGSTLVLNSVALGMHAEISAVGSLKNDTASPIIGGVIYSGPITLTAPGVVLTVPQLLVGAVAVIIPANGTTHFGPLGSGNNTAGFGSTAAFYGPGNVAVPLTSGVNVNLTGSANTAIAYAAGEGAFGKVTLDVTYDYTCTDVRVPEPKVYGLIGAALSLGVLGYRQYRSKKA